MRKTFIILLYSAITDLLVSSIKLFGGVISGSGSLIADAFYTFSNFITDIMAIIGSKISKKRPNKIHPFGYGKVQYVASIFMGGIIFIIGIFILFLGFQKKELFPNIITISVILISIFLKMISSLLLFYSGRKQHNPLLLANAKISFTDIYSTSIVLIIIILAFFLPNNSIFHYIDILGSIIIGAHILWMATNILKENTIAIIGEIDNDNELIQKIEQEVETIKNVDLINIKLIKYGSYYKAQLTVYINPNLRIKDFIKIEHKINQKIKKSKFEIKYTTIEIADKK